jgi:hypothetical protein
METNLPTPINLLESKCCVFGWWFQRFFGFQLSTIEMDNDPQRRAYFFMFFSGELKPPTRIENDRTVIIHCLIA